MPGSKTDPTNGDGIQGAHRHGIPDISSRPSSVLNQVNDDCILEIATISGTPEGLRERTGLRAVGVEFGLSNFKIVI